MNMMLPVAVVVLVLSHLTPTFVSGYSYPIPLETRGLQGVQTLNYRAIYRADFQHLLDPSCDGMKSLVGVQCLSANVTILGTSGSIDCLKVEDPTVPGSVFACLPLCTGDECEEVYRPSNASTFFDGAFGSVTFMCDADDYRNISATFVYLGENTTCSNTSVASQTRNYHAARLGVSCLVGSGREFVFDDSYFECTSFSPPINTKEGTNDDAYTCISGNDCGGEACDVTINLISIVSDVPEFFDNCVEKETTEGIAPPTESPPTSFQYTAQFEANWAVFYNTSDTSVCSNAHGGAVVSCDSGSSITYVSSSDVLMNCTPMNDFELMCIGTEESINNQFTQVNFNCTGLATPTSRVTFLQSDAVCSLVLETVTVSHAVALGVVCFSGSVPIYFDTYTECDIASHQFYAGSDEYHFPYQFLVCNETASFVLGTSTTQQNIPNVTIRTDNYWLTLTSKDCITRVPANQIPVAPAPATVPPTQVPSATSIEDVSILPTMDPTTKTTTSPLSLAPVLTGTREVPPTSTSMSDSDNSSDNGTLIGIVVGCAVVGFLVTAVIGYLVLVRKRDSPVTAEKTHLSVADTSPTENEGNDEYPQPPAGAIVSSTPAVVPSAPALSRRVTTSTEYLPDQKDQCRDVPAMPKTENRAVYANEPSGLTENEGIPIVSAIGVSVTSAGSREPSGRQFVDM